MAQKFTVIYIDCQTVGSHRHTMVKYKRVTLNNGESIVEMLQRENLDYSVQYIFEGWVKEFGWDDNES